jgi:probable aminopeptidase NPEPL1
MLKGVDAGDMGSVVSSVGGEIHRVYAAVLPSGVSRHNSASRSESISRAAKGKLKKGTCAVILGLDSQDHAEAAVAAIARTLHLYCKKTGSKQKPATLNIVATLVNGEVVPISTYAQEVASVIRTVASLVDTPTAEMTTADFVTHAKAIVKGLPNVTTKVIVGEALSKAGLGGIYGVGKAAVVAPRLLILDYKPARSKGHIALVGKGVVYDTGGLNIKVGGSMSTMKADMGGAAATLGAFRVLAASKCKKRITALCPLAENAVDAHSYRPDDILTMHSGHTVEINNTDAEGRLLLGDAVSYAARKFKPDCVINAATLTGAQLVATGHIHAAVVSNRDGLEQLAVREGRRTGDLCHPLLFAPEFFKSEFASEVADFRNSVKDRMNAQSSCAAQFVYNHIDDLDIPWLHIDLAGPAHRADRATGFGVALMAALAEHIDEQTLRS